MENKKIDALDEALRIIYLEGDADDTLMEKKLSHILSVGNGAEMSENEKRRLFAKLGELNETLTLGQVIREKLQGLQMPSEQLSGSIALPAHVINDLIDDKIYTNNVPIVFFRDLLKKLNISFEQAEKSIRKTFELLQNSALGVPTAHTFRASFRRNLFPLDDTRSSPVHRSDGRELYENKEAMEKYLNRLGELLND